MLYVLAVIVNKGNLMNKILNAILQLLLSIIIFFSFFHVYLDDLFPQNEYLKVIMVIIAILIFISFAITAKTKFLKKVFVIGAIIYTLLNILIWIL